MKGHEIKVGRCARAHKIAVSAAAAAVVAAADGGGGRSA